MITTIRLGLSYKGPLMPRTHVPTITRLLLHKTNIEYNSAKCALFSNDFCRTIPDTCVATYRKLYQIRVLFLCFWSCVVFVERLLADAYCTDYTIVVWWAVVRPKFSCLSLQIWLDGLSWSAVESCVLTIRLLNDLSESNFCCTIIGTCVRGISHCVSCLFKSEEVYPQCQIITILL